VQPLFAAAPSELIEAAAVAFADAVSERASGDGVLTSALIGIGTR
jgi:hypothetical protein